ncbi:glycosyltransferase family 2 protein [Patescibacteria group bacterium]|nr:glycosyltransferase family 2 protein [Patescibacteria group bacterium]MCL5798003.1 glycosyltransferase family 2 protein [Patescibacteria group bacterium]
MISKTAVIILHYKSWKDTAVCLSSIYSRGSDLGNKKVYIVSNSGDFGIPSEIDKRYKGIELIINDSNIGYSAANNVGLRKALQDGYKYFILLNNDTLVSAKSLDNLAAFGFKNPQVGLVSPKIYFASGSEYHSQRYTGDEKGRVIWYAGGLIDWKNIYASHRGVDEVDTGQYDEICDTGFSTGCCMFISGNVIDKIGFLDEKYFLYFEDVDFSLRAKRAGFEIKYYPGVSIWHKNAETSGKPGSKLHIYYQLRNRLYFGIRYAPLRAKKSLLLESFRDLFKGNIFRQAVADFYKGKMGKGKL